MEESHGQREGLVRRRGRSVSPAGHPQAAGAAGPAQHKEADAKREVTEAPAAAPLVPVPPAAAAAAAADGVAEGGRAATAAALDTTPLDGLRAVLNVWIMVFHACFFIMYFLPEADATAIFSRSLLVEHGYLAVDGFMVLTGYLMGLKLLSSGVPGARRPLTLRDYYFDRFLRIMPAYAVMIVAHCWVVNRAGSFRRGLVRLAPAATMFDFLFPTSEFVDNGCASAGVNVVHLSMLLPYNGCFMHSWSVGVQYHAYLWLPVAWLALRLWEGRRLAAFIGGVEVVSVVLRAAGHAHHTLFPADTMSAGMLDLFWYSNTLLRMHTIVLGVGAAYLSTRTSVHSFLASRRALPLHLAATLATGAFLWLTTQWKEWFGDYRREASVWNTGFMLLFAVGGIVPALLFVWLFLTAVSGGFVFGAVPAWCGRTAGGAPWRPLSALLSSRLLRRAADLSYVAYLMHPLVYNTLYASPWLLYPPSAVDAAPWSLVTGASSVRHSNASFVVTGAFAAPATAWFRFRDWAMPHGAPLTAGGLALCAVIAITATYALSAAIVAWVEAPAIACLRRTARFSRPAVLWYSLAILVIGPLAHFVAVGGIAAWLRPETEAAWVAALSPANTTTPAVAAADPVESL